MHCWKTSFHLSHPQKGSISLSIADDLCWGCTIRCAERDAVLIFISRFQCVSGRTGYCLPQTSCQRHQLQQENRALFPTCPRRRQALTKRCQSCQQREPKFNNVLIASVRHLTTLNLSVHYHSIGSLNSRSPKGCR
jgi:hypothetical protein